MFHLSDNACQRLTPLNTVNGSNLVESIVISDEDVIIKMYEILKKDQMRFIT